MRQITRILVAMLALTVLAGQGAQQDRAVIGDATMLADGTIVVRMRRTADGRNVSGTVTYRINDPNYEMVLNHIGGMKPGDIKLVYAWPEPERK